MRNVLDGICTENQNAYFLFSDFSRKSRR